VTSRTRRLAGLLLAVASLASVPGCTTRGAFFTDERLDIVSPADRSTVVLPLVVRWTVDDFEVTGPDGADRDDAGYFALFLDRGPMPPGEGLGSLVDDDDDTSCVPGASCPDRAFLADRNVFTTKSTSFRFDTMADRSEGARRGAGDRHEVTIVLLSGSDERIGESAFSVSFTIDREPPGGAR
jgi:hypothetical protein